MGWGGYFFYWLCGGVGCCVFMSGVEVVLVVCILCHAGGLLGGVVLATGWALGCFLVLLLDCVVGGCGWFLCIL